MRRLALCALLLAAGCGSDDTPTLLPPQPRATPAHAELTRCMRAHGVRRFDPEFQLDLAIATAEGRRVTGFIPSRRFRLAARSCLRQ